MGRKLLPALYRLRHRGLLLDNSVVLGVAVETNINDESFRARARDELIASGLPREEIVRITGKSLFYQPLPTGDADGFHKLAERITAIEADRQLPGNRVL